MESSKIDSESKCTEDVEMVDVQQQKEKSSGELQQSLQVATEAEVSTFETESKPSKNETVITGNRTRTSKVKVEAVNNGDGSSKKLKVSNVRAKTFKVNPEDTYPLFFKSACKIDPKSLIGTGSLSKSSDEANPPKSEEKIDKISQVSKNEDEFFSLKTFQIDQMNNNVGALVLPKAIEDNNVVVEDINYPMLLTSTCKTNPKNLLGTGSLSKSSDEAYHPMSVAEFAALFQVSKILDKVASDMTFLKEEMELNSIIMYNSLQKIDRGELEMEQTAIVMYDCLQMIDQEKLEFEKIRNSIKELQLDLKPLFTSEAFEVDAEIISQIKRQAKAQGAFYIAELFKQEE